MIHKCEDCKNRQDCPENQKQYRALCRALEKLEKKEKYHCYYSLKLKCDYWIGDGVASDGDELSTPVKACPEHPERVVDLTAEDSKEEIFKTIVGTGIYPLLKHNDSLALFIESLMRRCAERVHTAGYVKIPPGSVVLTRVELDALKQYSSEHFSEEAYNGKTKTV